MMSVWEPKVTVTNDDAHFHGINLEAEAGIVPGNPSSDLSGDPSEDHGSGDDDEVVKRKRVPVYGVMKHRGDVL
jgi:hypothetical protein